MIPRYSLPEIADLFTDEARFARLARGRDPRHRGLGRARRRARRRRGRGAGTGGVRRRGQSTSGSGSPSTTSPPSSTSCRSAIGAPGGRLAALRPHVERRRRHRAVGARWCRPSTCSSTPPPTLEAADHRPGPRATGDTPMVGPHPRHPRRAHHLRGQARALGAAGAPRPGAAGPGPRGDRGRQALGRRRHVLQHRPAVEPYVCERARARARCRRPRCSPATATPSCSTRARRSARAIEAFAARDPPPPAHRGARGRGAVPRRVAEGLDARCRTSATR